MRQCVLALGFSALLTTMTIAGLPALAADDTWVSAAGTDTGACALTAPCRTLRFALAQTTAGGTITILTAGRYPPVRINKSVHIMAEGVEAVISGAGQCDAVVCIAAGPNDVVSLRGVTVLSVGASYGIRFEGGAGLHLDSCKIGEGAPIFGVAFHPTAAAHLHMFDSKVAAAGHGVELAAGTDTRAILDRVEVHDGNQGIVFQGVGSGSIQGAILNSLIAGYHGYGLWSASSTASIAVMLDRSVVVNGMVGVSGFSTLRVGDSVMGGHFQFPFEGAASVLSYGNNKIVDGVDSIIVPTKIPLK